MRRRASQSTPGRTAAAMMKPKRIRAKRSFSFQSATATTTIAPATSVATAVRRAVCPMTRDFSPGGEARKPMQTSEGELVWLDARRHGIVLLRPFLKAGVVAAGGVVLFG